MFIKLIALYVIFSAKFKAILTQNENPVVETKLGAIRGKQVLFDETDSVDVFLGIPYAQPPLNSLRFSVPKPILPWNDSVLNATEPRNACMQIPQDYFNDTVPISEDCLYLNVWRPTVPLGCSYSANNCKLTTMFWIHAGGFTSRSAFMDLFDGRAIVSIGSVILVTINYRLDAFSFITDGSDESPGNLAFYDQLCALHWVNDNIISFGGNPNSITIFGQSAGSVSISALIVSPLVMTSNKKLFNRAILQSGSTYIYTGIEYSTQTHYKTKSRALAQSLDCEGDKWFDCLRAVNSSTLLNYAYATGISFSLPLQGNGDQFNPIKTVNALESGMFIKDIDVMFGTVRDERSSFVYLVWEIAFEQMFSPNFNKSMAETLIGELIVYSEVNRTEIIDYYTSLISENSSTVDDIRKVVYDLVGDYYITCPTYLFGQTFANYSPFSKVYGYVLTHQIQVSVLPVCGLAHWMGVCHSDDVALVFGLPLRYPQLYSTDDHTLSTIMIKNWTAFAKYGNPNTKDMRENWPEFRPNLNLLSSRTAQSTQTLFEINLNMNNTFNNIFKNNCNNIWAKYFKPTANNSEKFKL